MSTSPRIALFGMECRFTSATLAALLQCGVKPAAIYLPGPPGFDGLLGVPAGRELPIIASKLEETTSVSRLAQQAAIPVRRVGDLKSPETQRQILSGGVELILASCFNRKIPTALVRAAAYGGLNLHPSLLPELRGPDPLFWTLREGTGRSAITLHRLTSRFDAGPILAQQRVAYFDGMDEGSLEQRLATVGARMFAGLIPKIMQGTATERAQDDARATYARFPNPRDLVVTPSVPARTAYNFSRGMTGRGLTLEYRHGARIEIIEALGYQDSDWSSPVNSADDRTEQLAFLDGYLIAKTRRTRRAGRLTE